MKRLREGISTGSCMTAGALASVIWQQTGQCPEWVTVQTPIGKELKIEIFPMEYGSCCVIKDGGDDPDVTHGCRIITKVKLCEDHPGEVFFSAGEGVGKVTKAGLSLPVGEPAINPVPRKMTREHLQPYLKEQSAHITVSVPEGEKIAQKTFNPRLGVMGGISILGTTGIVRPMSEDAIKDSLKLELSMIYEQGYRYVVFVTGNQGQTMLQKRYGSLGPVIMAGNHIGFLIEQAADLGIQGILIAGQYGKLLKLAGGIMNTHSHVADGKMEILCTHAALAGVKTEIIQKIYECRTAKEADDLLQKYQLEQLWDKIVEKAQEKTTLCGRNLIKTGVVFLDGAGRIKAKSSQVEELLEKVAKKNG
jgi:cobalt-precorrin-5B (C1)-methyltransferase